jgi:hypothetical protein
VDGEACRSPRVAGSIGDCAEGAFFAAAALHVHGHESLAVHLEAVREDGHLSAVCK